MIELIIDVLISLVLLGSGGILYAKGYIGESIPLLIAGICMAIFIVYILRRKG